MRQDIIVCDVNKTSDLIGCETNVLEEHAVMFIRLDLYDLEYSSFI